MGFLGLRLNLGILSMASGLGKDRCGYPQEKLGLKLVLVAVFTRGLNNSDSPSIRSKGDGDLGVRRGIASGPLGWWRSGRQGSDPRGGLWRGAGAVDGGIV